MSWKTNYFSHIKRHIDLEEAVMKDMVNGGLLERHGYWKILGKTWLF